MRRNYVDLYNVVIINLRTLINLYHLWSESINTFGANVYEMYVLKPLAHILIYPESFFTNVSCFFFLFRLYQGSSRSRHIESSSFLVIAMFDSVIYVTFKPHVTPDTCLHSILFKTLVSVQPLFTGSKKKNPKKPKKNQQQQK